MSWSSRSAAAFSILAVLVAWLYHPVLVSLVRQWWDDSDYSHGFLIPLIASYLVWQRRERLRNAPATPRGSGLVVLVGGVGLFILANMAAELFVMRVSLLVIVAGLILFLLGRAHLKLLAFPLLYLLFMIPPPAIVFNAITVPLQLFAASAATTSLQLLDVPVLREGNLIILANTTLEVAAACSGVRSLLALVALAVTYAYFTQDRFWGRALLFVSAVPIAIVANATRVIATGILAQFLGDEAARGFFHTFSGWLVFVAAFVLLCVEGFLVSRLRGRAGSTAVRHQSGSVAADEPFAVVARESRRI